MHSSMEGILLVVLFFVSASSELIWTGNFNSYSSSSDLDTWSFANPVGEYKTYIYGNINAGTKMSTYVSLSADYKNPGEKIGTKGARVQIDSTSRWNQQTMLRTELIPNFENSDVQKNTLFYKFSIKQGTTNQLRKDHQHQLVFFESHFCDLKYGNSGSSSGDIRFEIGGNQVWSAPFTPDTWLNFAFEVDYSGNKVGLWYSKDNNKLARVVDQTSASVSQSDFHLGSLRLPNGGNQDPNTEWLYYSGVYVETTLTDNLGGKGGSAPKTCTSNDDCESKVCRISGTCLESGASITTMMFGTILLLIALALF